MCGFCGFSYDYGFIAERPQLKLHGFQNFGAAWQWYIFGGRERGGSQALSGGGGGVNTLNVRATKLNSKEAHEVTDGHNAHYNKDREDTVTITMEWNQAFHKK